jgi:general secretion pathway protein A
VLIIDEAQNLSADVLEQLRLLTNLETSERKLLQIILIGQPELRLILARPELEQLAQRVIARYHLGSLSEHETGSYVTHRLAVAGAGAATPFPRALMAQIHRLTHGVPRRINLLCDRALLGARRAGRSTSILRKAADEVFGGPCCLPRRAPAPLAAGRRRRSGRRRSARPPPGSCCPVKRSVMPLQARPRRPEGAGPRRAPAAAAYASWPTRCANWAASGANRCRRVSHARPR